MLKNAFRFLTASLLGAICHANATSIAPLSDLVWVDLEGNYFYQVPVSIVPSGEDISASVRIYEKFPYRKITKVGDDYVVSQISNTNFNQLKSQLTEHGKRLRGDFDGDGYEDLIVQTPNGDEFIVSRDLAKPFDVNSDIGAISGLQIVDVNSDLKDDLLNPQANTVQFASSEGFTQSVGTSEYVGTLGGESNVSPIGDFNYDINITTNASTGSHKPNLSLSYSSGPDNGHLGVGWALGGMSSINRCEQNIETDNNVTKINFTSTDRFCLDGQRLIVKNGSTYGGNGTEYRTAQDSFQKIIAYTSNTSKGPDRFVVYDSKGNIFHYGKYSINSNSTIKTTSGKHFAWALAHVEDASKNYYSFTYGKTTGSLEYYPTTLNYSGRTGSHGTKNKVTFTYESRSDLSESYIAGFKTTTTKRLKSIQSYYNTQLVRRYKLTYKTDLTSFGGGSASLLSSVTSCDAADLCLSPTVFTWNQRNLAGYNGSQSRDFSRTSRYKGHQLLDFNGDGLLDIAYVRNDRGSSTDHLFLIKNNGRTLTHIKTFNDIASKTFRRTWKVVDYNKDGKDDILYLTSSSSYWNLMEYTSGTNFSRKTLTALPRPNSDARSRFVDMNADGMPDLMHIVGNQLKVQKGTKTAVSSTQSTVQIALEQHYDNSTVSLLDYDKDDNTFTSTDFNGDGRADFLVQVSERVSTGGGECGEFGINCCNPITMICEQPRSIQPLPAPNINQGSSNSLDAQGNTVGNNQQVSPAPGNALVINKTPKLSAIVATRKSDLSVTQVALETGAYRPSLEGLTDEQKIQRLAEVTTLGNAHTNSVTTYTNWRILLSQPGTNGGFKLEEYANLWRTNSADFVRPINLNGDGLTDLVYRNKSDKKWYAAINNGNGFNAPKYVRTVDKEFLVTGDINGDGASEIMYKSGDYLYFMTYKNGSFTSHYYGRDTAGYDELNFADMDGDGVHDRFLFRGRSHTDFRADTGTNRIVNVIDGFGNQTIVGYQTLNHPSVYQKENDGRNKNWGNGSLVTDLKGSVRVVSSLTKNGDQLRYKYIGGKAQVGRGILGYRQIQISSLATSLRTTTTYRQDGIYRGSPKDVLIEAIVETTSVTPDPGPVPDPCDISPRFCECPPGSQVCDIYDIRSIPEFKSALPASQSGISATPLNTTTEVEYKKKSETIYSYGVKTNGNFKIGSYTKAEAVYPASTTTYQYNIDTPENELLATKTSSVSLDSYGNPTSQTQIHSDKYVWAKTAQTIKYSYANYGGRVTENKTKKERINTYNNVDYREPTVETTLKYSYDSRGLLTQLTSDNGMKTTYDLNMFGLVVKETVSAAGLSNRITVNKFDVYGRHMTETSNDLGHKTTIAYNTKGFKDYEVSANGQRLYFNYDGIGRQISEIRTPQNNTSKTGPNALSNSKVQYWCNGVSHCPVGSVYYEEITEEGSPSSRGYKNKRGETIRASSQSMKTNVWVIQDFVYDSVGRKLSESAPYLSTASTSLSSQITYDSQNRVIEIIKPDSGVWKTTYDGFSISTTDPLGNVTVGTKNGLGDPVESIDANGSKSWTLYHTLGSVRLITDPVGNKIQISYDKYGNKTQLIDPNAGTIAYGYNAYQEHIYQKDANGNEIFLEYDKLGRKSREYRKTNTGVLEHDFRTTYDAGAFAIGQESSLKDFASGYQEQYFYDTFGRLKEKRTQFDGFSYSEKSTFDIHGRLIEEIDASGSGVKHLYNVNNWAYQTRDKTTNALYWQALEVDAFGKVSKDRLGSNINRTLTRDAATGLLNKVTTTGSGTLQNLEYDWDVKGNLTYRRDINKGLREDFQYDDLNRVTESKVSGQTSVTTTINYNAIGNITSKSGVGTYTYHASKPHAVKAVSGTMANAYTYDSAGNIIKDNQRTFVNNSFNKPVTIFKSDYFVDFKYGKDGKRYKRVESGQGKGTWVTITSSGVSTFVQTKTETHYIGNVEFVRMPGTNQWTAKRYIGDKILISQSGSVKTIRYTLNDHLGSTNVIVKADGKKEQEMSFDVFGARRNADNWARDHKKVSTLTSNITLRGYTGHEQLDELGLVHMGGRIYDPVLGRFLQADPAIQQPTNIQSFNRYSYVMNNPLNATDPSGYFWVTLLTFALDAMVKHAVFSAAISAAISTALTAYQFYGYFQLAKGTLQAIQGGGTAMANFAGGLVKSYIKQLGDTLIVQGIAIGVGFGIHPDGPDYDELSKEESGLYKISNVRENDQGEWEYDIEPVDSVKTKHAAINGMLNGKERAAGLMIEHVHAQFGDKVTEFTLFHNPTEGFMKDGLEAFADKIGLTTDITKEFAKVLQETDGNGLGTEWVAHSQGGVIFTEAVRYNGGKMENISVAFHAGANHRGVTRGIMADAGVTILKWRDHPLDPVPNLAGFNTMNPIKIHDSIEQLYWIVHGTPEQSPHTLPYMGGKK